MLKNKLFQYVFLSLVSLSAVGCTATNAATALGIVAKSALEATGLKKPDTPEVPDALKLPRTISIKLHASEILNSNSSGRPLALVTKIYKLRQNAAFQQATYDTFLSPQKEKEALGTDLLEVKEVTLIPGQRYEISEKTSQEAYYIGIVALFHNPAPSRWRVVFPAGQAEQSGIIIGLHACALTVGTGVTATGNLTKNQLLSSVRCP
ncbi:MAG: type VI secretion system lipoprotein TssJ [Glaciimonas sp.]|nr:type VI secretion system lipoprotein TssJ [Glaciimonas sp.]